WRFRGRREAASGKDNPPHPRPLSPRGRGEEESVWELLVLLQLGHDGPDPPVSPVARGVAVDGVLEVRVVQVGDQPGRHAGEVLARNLQAVAVVRVRVDDGRQRPAGLFGPQPGHLVNVLAEAGADEQVAGLVRVVHNAEEAAPGEEPHTPVPPGPRARRLARGFIVVALRAPAAWEPPGATGIKPRA